MRVLSLLASATEIVCALGHGDSLVGRSHECDWPEWVARLPHCTRPKLNVDGDSAAIDREVKALVAQGLSVYEVDTDALRALAPDVIVTQTQCEVCAVSEADLVDALALFAERRPEVVSLHPDALDDVFADIERVARALGTPERGAALVAEMRARMDTVRDAVSGTGARPRAACIEWIEPLMAAGNWMPELVALAGGENLFGAAGGRSPWLDFEALAAADPDVIAVLPCGFDLARTRAEMPALTGRPGWRDLRAARTGRVALVDGNAYFNRPGPRLAESAEILAEILRPDSVDFGHRGAAWAAL